MEEEVLEQQEQEQEQENNAPAANETTVSTPTADYSLEPFNLERALAGNTVTYIPPNSTLQSLLASVNNNPAKISGLLVHQPSSINPPYYVKIGGTVYYADRYGVIQGTNPAESLKMLVAVMNSDTAIGTDGAITRGLSPGQESNVVDLSSMEPRDQMAVHALNSMLDKIEHPDSVDDATILQYTRAAYRWAQGMVIASSDSRPEESSEPSPTPATSDVTPVTTNDKLLNNIVVALDELKKAAIGTTTPAPNIAGKLNDIINTIISVSNSNIAVPLNNVKAAILTLAGKFDVPTVGNITINTSVQSPNLVVLAFVSGSSTSMACSDLVVYLTLACTAGSPAAAVTRFVTLHIPAGTSTYIHEVADVVSITSITAKTFGSKAPKDPNTYTI